MSMSMLKGVKDKDGVVHGFGFTEVKVPYAYANEIDWNVPLFLLQYFELIKNALAKGEVQELGTDGMTEIPVSQTGFYEFVPDMNNDSLSNPEERYLHVYLIVGTEILEAQLGYLVYQHATCVDPLSYALLNQLSSVGKNINVNVDGNLHIFGMVTADTNTVYVSLVPLNNTTA